MNRDILKSISAAKLTAEELQTAKMAVALKILYDEEREVRQNEN